MTIQVKAKSKWLLKSKAIDKTAHVMAVAEGYVMLRYTRCAPFLLKLEDFLETYEPMSKS